MSVHGGVLLQEDGQGGAEEFHLQPTTAAAGTEGHNQAARWQLAGWTAGHLKLTNLGNEFFANATDRFFVSFPVSVDIMWASGTIYKREDWLAPTATQLEEIEIRWGVQA